MTSDAIQLPDAPGIHDLRFRHFRGGNDFNHMATITRVSAEADDTERADTPEELEKWLAHLTNCDPYTDMIFAEVGVDSENLSGATKVYEDCGFGVMKLETVHRKPLITIGQQ